MLWMCRKTLDDNCQKANTNRSLVCLKTADRALLDHETVGNLLSTQARAPLTKTLVSMPTRPLLGESSFQTRSIPHLCYRRTSGHWRGNKLWVADEDAIVSKQDGNGLSREPQSCCRSVHGPMSILYTLTLWLLFTFQLLRGLVRTVLLL